MFQRPKGTADILPESLVWWQKIERAIDAICQRYQYHEVRTPLFEATELFQRGVGQTTDVVEKEMYTFIDKGDRSMTLRPEGTAGVVRAYIENKRYGLPGVQRLYYVGPMFRYEQPQSGRYRQFHQFGIEAFGSGHPDLDVETIALGQHFCEELGIADVSLEINSVGTATERSAYALRLQQHLDPIRSSLCADCQNRLYKNPLRVLDCKVDQHLFVDVPVLEEHLSPTSLSHYEAVQRQLTQLSIPWKKNPRLVRGLDYYTHTAFEWNVRSDVIGAIQTIGGGGRYDHLVEQLGGPPTPAVGLAFGIERLVLALERSMTLTEMGPLAYFVGFDEQAHDWMKPLLYACRRAGLSVAHDIERKKAKTQLKQAVREQATFALLIGEQEMAQRSVLIKQLSTGAQQTVGVDQLIAWLQDAQHRLKVENEHTKGVMTDALEK